MQPALEPPRRNAAGAADEDIAPERALDEEVAHGFLQIERRTVDKFALLFRQADIGIIVENIRGPDESQPGRRQRFCHVHLIAGSPVLVQIFVRDIGDVVFPGHLLQP